MRIAVLRVPGEIQEDGSLKELPTNDKPTSYEDIPDGMWKETASISDNIKTVSQHITTLNNRSIMIAKTGALPGSKIFFNQRRLVEDASDTINT